LLTNKHTGRGTDFLELVIGNNNQFVGKSLATLRHNFAEKYGASVIAVRRHNTSNSTNDELDLKGSNDLQSNVPVTPGDIVLVLAKDDVSNSAHLYLVLMFICFESS
jgi:Trk K+ transport system NAD-binding subunit